MKNDFYDVKKGGKTWYKLPPKKELNKPMTIIPQEVNHGRKSCEKIKKKTRKTRV